MRIAAGFYHSYALTDDGRTFLFGERGGTPDAVDDDDFGWTCQNCGSFYDADVTECSHVFDDGRDYGYEHDDRPCEGLRPSRQLSPNQLQGALADTTVLALGGGCFASHSAFVPGAPPCAPGFDAPLTFAMQKPAANKLKEIAVMKAMAGAAAEAEQHVGGGAMAATAPAPAATVAGTKRKRDDTSDDGGQDHGNDC